MGRSEEPAALARGASPANSAGSGKASGVAHRTSGEDEMSMSRKTTDSPAPRGVRRTRDRAESPGQVEQAVRDRLYDRAVVSGPNSDVRVLSRDESVESLGGAERDEAEPRLRSVGGDGAAAAPRPWRQNERPARAPRRPGQK